MAERHTYLGVYALAILEGSVVLIRKGRGPYTGKWDLPGGGIEFGESPLDALAREFREETGLSYTEPQLLDVVSIRFSHRLAGGAERDLHHIGILYKTTVASVAGLKRDPDGQDSLGTLLVPLREATALDLTPFARHAIDKVTHV